MSDSITQKRLSMRLDLYLSDYTGKKVKKETLSSAEWNKVWRIADVARLQNDLTPELVDDVRVVLLTL
jgi:hypothetical protein